MMINNHKDLEKLLHRRYLARLNMSRFVSKPSFIAAYVAASILEKDYILELLFDDDTPLDEVEEWTRDILKIHKLYEHLDTQYLREVAKTLLVKNYSQMGKLQLLGYLSGELKEGKVSV